MVMTEIETCDQKPKKNKITITETRLKHLNEKTVSKSRYP